MRGSGDQAGLWLAAVVDTPRSWIVTLQSAASTFTFEKHTHVGAEAIVKYLGVCHCPLRTLCMPCPWLLTALCCVGRFCLVADAPRHQACHEDPGRTERVRRREGAHVLRDGRRDGALRCDSDGVGMRSLTHCTAVCVVCGQIEGSENALKFCQAFQMVHNGTSYYIHNDLFRLNYG